MGRKDTEKCAKLVNPSGVATRKRARRKQGQAELEEVRKNALPEFIDLTVSSPPRTSTTFTNIFDQLPIPTSHIPFSPPSSPPTAPPLSSHLLPFPLPSPPSSPAHSPTDEDKWYYLHKWAGFSPHLVPPPPAQPFIPQDSHHHLRPHLNPLPLPWHSPLALIPANPFPLHLASTSLLLSLLPQFKGLLQALPAGGSDSKLHLLLCLLLAWRPRPKEESTA